MALAALSGGLFALEHDDQLHELRQLREQLDLLGKWAITHNDPDGRMLQSVAMALRLLSNGGDYRHCAPCRGHAAGAR